MPTKCDACGKDVEWIVIKKQFKRAIDREMKPEEAKALGYHCQKCRTAYFKEHGILTAYQKLQKWCREDRENAA